jgi:hypothetical protein
MQNQVKNSRISKIELNSCKISKLTCKTRKKKTREPAKSDSTHVKSVKVNIIKNHDFATNFTSLMEL